jgi:tRNA A37 threonylcarbamoyladenosine biosynthesis protein TsaE
MGCCETERRRRDDSDVVVITGGMQAGKTVIFFKLTDHPNFTQPVPTRTFNTETIYHRNRNLTLIDLSS